MCVSAIFLYFQAITTPASDISYIMLNAYKKFILVSLLEHSKVSLLFTLVPVFLGYKKTAPKTQLSINYVLNLSPPPKYLVVQVKFIKG